MKPKSTTNCLNNIKSFFVAEENKIVVDRPQITNSEFAKIEIICDDMIFSEGKYGFVQANFVGNFSEKTVLSRLIELENSGFSVVIE